MKLKSSKMFFAGLLLFSVYNFVVFVATESAASQALKKTISRPDKLSEKEKRKSKYLEFTYGKEKVFRAVKYVIKEEGYNVQDYKKMVAGADKDVKFTSNLSFGSEGKFVGSARNEELGIKNEEFFDNVIVGFMEERSLYVTAIIEETDSDNVGVRLIVKNEHGIVENERLYSQMFKRILKYLNQKGDKL